VTRLALFGSTARDTATSGSDVDVLVAFANSAGGRLVIGVADENRAVVGVKEPLGLEERLASLVADSIEPALLPEIEIVPWRQQSGPQQGFARQ
jgi:predicted nucleotidyltransferase